MRRAKNFTTTIALLSLFAVTATAATCIYGGAAAPVFDWLAYYEGEAVERDSRDRLEYIDRQRALKGLPPLPRNLPGESQGQTAPPESTASPE